MNSSKKILLSTIGIAVIIVALVGVTFAFFNYTRTGSSNVVKVGRIYFNSEQGNSINLDNIFPIDKADVDTDIDNVGSVTIHITGDTTYNQGIEYLVTAVEVNNNTNVKFVPISAKIDVNNLGNSDEEYFTNRGGNESIYIDMSHNYIVNDGKIVAGYIPKGEDGVDGTITIKAYIDKDKIAISDTYPEEEFTEKSIVENPSENSINQCIDFFSQYEDYLEEGKTISDFCHGTSTLDGMELEEFMNMSYYEELFINFGYINVKTYTNGTSVGWLNGRTVLTTNEWNSFQENGLSFKIKVEANQGIWVDKKPVNNCIHEIREENGVGNDHFIYGQYGYTYYSNSQYNVETISVAVLNRESELPIDTPICTTVNGKPVDNLNSLFANSKASSIDLSSFDTSNVENMNLMFAQLNLSSLDISVLDTSNVKDARSMFLESNIDDLKIENDFSNAETMYAMFMGATIGNLDFGNNFDATKVEDMSWMFQNSNIDTIDLSNVKTGALENMKYMFNHANATSIIFGSDFKTNNVTDMSYAFSNSHVTSLDLSNFNTSNVTKIYDMFDCCRATTIYVSELWNLDKISDTTTMFYNSAVVGENGTRPYNGCSEVNGNFTCEYNNNYSTHKLYARIDNPPDSPGFLTYKAHS